MSSIDACRFCLHYAPEGRRGGHCHKLQVSVSANWDACPFADHPFSSEWDVTLSRLGDHAIDRNIPHLQPVNNLGNTNETPAILPFT